jgi:hypothetical protein
VRKVEDCCHRKGSLDLATMHISEKWGCALALDKNYTNRQIGEICRGIVYSALAKEHERF